jgi:hypothetical protein
MRERAKKYTSLSYLLVETLGAPARPQEGVDSPHYTGQ